jgi:hypothetical protein
MPNLRLVFLTTINAATNPPKDRVQRHGAKEQKCNWNAAMIHHHSGVPLWQARHPEQYAIDLSMEPSMANYVFGAPILAVFLVLLPVQGMATDKPPADPDPNQAPPLEEFKPLTGLDNTPKGGTLPGGTLPGGTLRGGTLPGGTVPGGTLPGGTLPGGTLPGGTVPGGPLPGGTVPGGTLPGGTLAGGPL